MVDSTKGCANTQLGGSSLIVEEFAVFLMCWRMKSFMLDYLISQKKQLMTLESLSKKHTISFPNMSKPTDEILDIEDEDEYYE